MKRIQLTEKTEEKSCIQWDKLFKYLLTFKFYKTGECQINLSSGFKKKRNKKAETELENHIRTVLRKEKPLKCTMCDKKFDFKTFKKYILPQCMKERNLH